MTWHYLISQAFFPSFDVFSAPKLSIIIPTFKVGAPLRAQPPLYPSGMAHGSSSPWREAFGEVQNTAQFSEWVAHTVASREWSARSIAQCPIQPVCNLGDGSRYLSTSSLNWSRDPQTPRAGKEISLKREGSPLQTLSLRNCFFHRTENFIPKPVESTRLRHRGL